jgi:class 3 adenylate cyclase/tetratricopeptide (TPR) repeat protein
MASCASCGAQNPALARFCNTCGTALAAAPSTNVSATTRKIVTALFCDVTGSTQLGERLDPESLKEVLGRFFATTRRLIQQHGGTVEKFIGDAVMAVFGVPVVHEDDALRAVRASWSISEALGSLNEELLRDFSTELQVRIGIDTGEVVTDPEELAIGDPVNTAARLEQAAEPGQILIGEQTMRLTYQVVEVAVVEPLQLKGKSRPVPAYRVVSVDTGDDHRRRSTTPIVDRRIELGRLREAFDEAVRSRSIRLFTIVGAAGVGKSRLTRELLTVIAEATVLSGRCLSYGQGITYWPIVEAITPLQSRLVELPLDTPIAATIESLLNGSAASTDEIAWAFRRLVETLAQTKPVILLFDDIQWGEDAFLDLVEHLTLVSRDAPVLLLCLARPDLLEKRSSWMTDVRLQPLEASDAELLIDRCMAGLEVSPSIRNQILNSAGGNPLFVEEMSAVAQTTPEDEVRVPPTLRALLSARLDQLEAVERRVLECAAIEGEVFHLGAMQALLPGEPNLTRRLTALVRKDLIAPHAPQLPGEDAFRFRHLLIRDAAYDSMPKAVRAELHERFADWLRGKMGKRLPAAEAIVGYHLEQAYRYRAALGTVDMATRELARTAGELLASAANRALASGDCNAAIALFERAAFLIPSDEVAHFRLLPRLGRALRNAGEFQRALGVLDEAIAAASSTGQKSTELRARIERAVTLAETDPVGIADKLLEDVEPLIPVLEDLGDDEGLAAAWSAVAMVHNFAYRQGSMMEAQQRALRYARKIGDEVLSTDCETWICAGLIRGPTPRSEMAQFAADMGGHGLTSPLREAMALLVMAFAEALGGRFAQGRQLLSRGRAIFEKTSLYEYVAGTSSMSAALEMLAGDFAAAERDARRACDVSERLAANASLSTMEGELALALYKQGRYDEAERYAEVARKLGANSDIATQVLWRQALAKVLARRGENEEAVRLAEEAVTLMEGSDALSHHGDALVDLAEVLELVGKARGAVQPLQQALALYEQKGNIVSAAQVRACLVSLGDAKS